MRRSRNCFICLLVIWSFLSVYITESVCFWGTNLRGDKTERKTTLFLNEQMTRKLNVEVTAVVEIITPMMPHCAQKHQSETLWDSFHQTVWRDKVHQAKSSTLTLTHLFLKTSRHVKLRPPGAAQLDKNRRHEAPTRPGARSLAGSRSLTSARHANLLWQIRHWDGADGVWPRPLPIKVGGRWLD